MMMAVMDDGGCCARWGPRPRAQLMTIVYWLPALGKRWPAALTEFASCAGRRLACLAWLGSLAAGGSNEQEHGTGLLWVYRSLYLALLSQSNGSVGFGVRSVHPHGFNAGFDSWLWRSICNLVASCRASATTADYVPAFDRPSAPWGAEAEGSGG
ncbi:hypothetical protein B0T19DRAFT_427018 [Cercophora scortea]|uniref:Uncharacterized protein n=1 Tax=Cercophora scortea TaxID=314031 RepID=A0AAE0IEZ5_9PEZI|nr:hypothetical protein B0T19DRAFT_427018 [Cercophora scortea]